MQELADALKKTNGRSFGIVENINQFDLMFELGKACGNPVHSPLTTASIEASQEIFRNYDRIVKHTRNGTKRRKYNRRKSLRHLRSLSKIICGQPKQNFFWQSALEPTLNAYGARILPPGKAPSNSEQNFTLSVPRFGVLAIGVPHGNRADRCLNNLIVNTSLSAIAGYPQVLYKSFL